MFDPNFKDDYALKPYFIIKVFKGGFLISYPLRTLKKVKLYK